MADDNGSTEQEAEQDAEASSDAPKTKGSLSRRANRSLRRARALYEGNQYQPSTEAEYLIQEANVLALLDLAAAFRSRDDAGDSGE